MCFLDGRGGEGLVPRLARGTCALRELLARLGVGGGHFLGHGGARLLERELGLGLGEVALGLDVARLREVGALLLGLEPASGARPGLMALVALSGRRALRNDAF